MTTRRRLRTPLCDLLGIEHPIVQTAMGFVADARLTAATSNAGALGILAAAMLDLDELDAAIADVQERTDRPFGVNIRSDAPDARDRVDIMVRRGVRVASFAMAPREDLIRRLKDAGLVCIPSVGARRHAEKVVGFGADAVIVQGGEGGGHTGQTATTVLLPDVLAAVDVPVIAAGGFFDGRGLAAALAHGAAGVAMGTRFLLTAESPVPANVKATYLEQPVGTTVVTSKVDGQPHRMIRTPFVEQVDGSHGRALVRSARNAVAFKKMSGRPWSAILREGRALRTEQGYSLQQIVMAANAPMLCRAAMVDGRLDVGILSSGQVTGVIDDLPTCAVLVDRIVAEALAQIDRLAEYATSAASDAASEVEAS
ncbi:MAG: 2-nitropropane dioxygenase [Acidimicrobiales bacterium]|nr:2-nitropropane dioxygenase [Acidimicrobiales bacterium]